MATTAHIHASARDAIAHAGRGTVAPLAWHPGRHALSRFSFGPTPTAQASLDSRGPDAWWAEQVSLGTRAPYYQALPAVAAMTPLLTRSPAAIRASLKAKGNEYGFTAMDQLTSAMLALRTWSPAQLYEAVVDMFGDHLSVSNHNADLWNTRHTMDLDVIRRHAFGSFSDMLLASAKNPAMLLFLNNAESNKKALNENYGRELMELHTIGLGYTESDVVNSARILSGRTVDPATQAYRYDPDLHWVGPVTVQGFHHANSTADGGEAVGDAYLSYLATHPSTASTIARKLCIRFVSDSPSASLISQVAAVYLRNATAILPTVTAIWRSDEFWASQGAKVRRPTENMIATIRALGIGAPANLAKACSTLTWMANAMGNTPLEWRPPNGYPDVAAAWRSSGTLLYQWTLHAGLSQGWWPELGKAPGLTDLYGAPAPATSGQAVDALCVRLVGSRFTPTHRQALFTVLGEPDTTTLSRSTLRWNAATIVSLILNSPYHALR